MDVAMNRQELLVLPGINLVQIKGLILYMITAVLNCKGDEVVDLARTNLFI
jgi:pyruvate dehydrogenase (quinone)